MKTVNSYGSPASRWDIDHEPPRALTILRALEPLEAKCERCRHTYADRAVRLAFTSATLAAKLCTRCVKQLSQRIEAHQ